MIKFREYLEEGINDPAIFKAVFLAGGPGAGKTFIVGKTALTSLGFKNINSDEAFERAMENAGLTMDPETIFTIQGQTIRDRAKALTNRKMNRYIQGRLGLVIDGTGKDYEKIKRQKKKLEELGYETAMIFVNTDLETAINRDKRRNRSVGKDAVTKLWQSVQYNMGKFQGIFKEKMFIVDNNDDSNTNKGVLSVYKRIQKWTKEPPKNRFAMHWINSERQRIKRS